MTSVLVWKRVAVVVEEAHPSFVAEDAGVRYRLRADDAGAYRVHVLQGGRERVLGKPGDLDHVKAIAERHVKETRARRERESHKRRPRRR